MTEKKDQPPEHYEVGEPIQLGALPVRTELTVLPADEPKDKKLGWVVDVREGCEIYRSLETREVISTREGLVTGDVVYAPALVGGYYGKAGDHTLVFLEFLDDPAKDDRAPVWITPGAANLRGLRKLELQGS